MRYRRRASGLLAPEDGLAVPRLRGARAYDPASLGTLVGAKPPSFSPSDLANLFLWLDADAITGLNDNDAVVTWEDQSVNGRDFTQGTAGFRPTYQTGELNGLPVVRFDGTDNFLASAALTIAQPMTVYSVVKRTGNTGAFNVVMTTGSTTYTWPGFTNSANTWYFYTGAAFQTQTAADNVWHYLTLVVPDGGANSTMRTDGTPATVQMDNQDLSNDPFVMGATNVPSLPLAGDIAEHIIYNDEHDATEISQVEDYLTAKWGL